MILLWNWTVLLYSLNLAKNIINTIEIAKIGIETTTESLDNNLNNKIIHKNFSYVSNQFFTLCK